MYKRVEEYGLARQMTGSNTGYNSISISAMVNEKKNGVIYSPYQ